MSSSPENTAFWRNGILLRLLVSTTPASFSWAMSQLVVGWLVLTMTNSATAVGLAYIARLLPLAITGLPIGAASDRWGRVRVLELSNGLGLIGSVLLAAGGYAEAAAVPMAILGSVIYGVSDSARLVATPHLADDSVGHGSATRAIAAAVFVAGIGQVGGALVGGVILATHGPIVAAATVAAGYLLAQVPLIGMADRGERSRPEVRWFEQVRGGIALARHHDLVRLLFIVSIINEVFAFAGMALDPLFAMQAFGVGAAGLGAIAGSRSAGRLLGSFMVGWADSRRPFRRLLPSAVLLFGLALIGFAVSPALALGIVFVFVSGAAGAMVDSVEQAGLAAAAPGSERGRAEGLWVVAIGAGQPIGVIWISVVASALGPRVAQLASGGVVAVFGLLLVLGLYGRRLERIDASTINPAAGAPTS